MNSEEDSIVMGSNIVIIYSIWRGDGCECILPGRSNVNNANVQAKAWKGRESIRMRVEIGPRMRV